MVGSERAGLRLSPMLQFSGYSVRAEPTRGDEHQISGNQISGKVTQATPQIPPPAGGTETPRTCVVVAAKGAAPGHLMLQSSTIAARTNASFSATCAATIAADVASTGMNLPV